MEAGVRRIRQHLDRHRTPDWPQLQEWLHGLRTEAADLGTSAPTLQAFDDALSAIAGLHAADGTTVVLARGRTYGAVQALTAEHDLYTAWQPADL